MVVEVNTVKYNTMHDGDIYSGLRTFLKGSKTRSGTHSDVTEDEVRLSDSKPPSRNTHTHTHTLADSLNQSPTPLTQTPAHTHLLTHSLTHQKTFRIAGV